MSNVIKALVQMGSDANLQSDQNEQAVEQLLNKEEVDAEQTEAIINKDITLLELQLDVRLNMVCGVAPAEDDDEDEGDEDSTDEASNHAIGF